MLLVCQWVAALPTRGCRLLVQVGKFAAGQRELHLGQFMHSRFVRIHFFLYHSIHVTPISDSFYFVFQVNVPEIFKGSMQLNCFYAHHSITTSIFIFFCIWMAFEKDSRGIPFGEVEN